MTRGCNDCRRYRRQINALVDRHAQRVIRQIKRLPKEAMQSGDDSPLRNVWEEWVVQVRGEHSFFYDLYEHTIRQICRGVAFQMKREEQALIWMVTDEYIEWENEEEIPYGDPVEEAIEHELFRRICSVADDMELPQRMERYLYPPSD